MRCDAGEIACCIGLKTKIGVAGIVGIENQDIGSSLLAECRNRERSKIEKGEAGREASAQAKLDRAAQTSR